MIQVYEWIVLNWETALVIVLLIVVLSLTGTISKALKDAKKGLVELLNPLGLLVFAIICYLLYQIYLSVIGTL